LAFLKDINFLLFVMTANCQLPTGQLLLATADWPLITANCPLPTKKIPSLHKTKSQTIVFISDKISRTCFPSAKRGLFIDFADNYWLLLELLRLLRNVHFKKFQG
jgi:hypothetical protein